LLVVVVAGVLILLAAEGLVVTKPLQASLLLLEQLTQLLLVQVVLARQAEAALMEFLLSLVA
jgi:hypothetical protein